MIQSPTWTSIIQRNPTTIVVPGHEWPSVISLSINWHTNSCAAPYTLKDIVSYKHQKACTAMHAPRVTHVFGARACRVPIVNIDPQILPGSVFGNFMMSENFCPERTRVLNSLPDFRYTGFPCTDSRCTSFSCIIYTKTLSTLINHSTRRVFFRKMGEIICADEMR